MNRKKNWKNFTLYHRIVDVFQLFCIFCLAAGSVKILGTFFDATPSKQSILFSFSFEVSGNCFLFCYFLLYDEPFHFPSVAKNEYNKILLNCLPILLLASSRNEDDKQSLSN